MGIANSDLLYLVVKPTLRLIQQENHRAEQLLIEAAQTCELGDHITPCSGNGLGVFGITPLQHRSLWDTYLVHNPDLASQVRGLASQREFLAHPDEELITNLRYATAIAWLLIQQYLDAHPLALDETNNSDILKVVFPKASRELAA